VVIRNGNLPFFQVYSEIVMVQTRKEAPSSCGMDASVWLNEPQTASHISQLMDNFHVPGLAMALVDGSDIYSKAFGLACIVPQRPCTPDTLFDIASCSKAFTAIAVAVLVESDGFPSVKWDTVLSGLFPDDFLLSTPEANKVVTIEDVLSHRSGLPGHVSFLTSGIHELIVVATT
jgi:CubicO group peptidase (beta-lactamase class C family)